MAASALALSLELELNRMLGRPMTPFLPGFAAVIASAAWAGFGPGALSTALVSVWSLHFLQENPRQTAVDHVVRIGIFVLEGLLLCWGNARLQRARAAASRGEDWYKRLVETSGEGIWMTDPDGKIGYANGRMAEMLGVDSNAIAGKNARDFFFAADLTMEKIRQRSRRPGQREQFDRRLRRADGGEVWVLTCSSPFTDEELASPGESGEFSMMTDITERKHAEHALRRSEERFRGLFDNVLEGVYQSTPEGRITAANPMLFRMLGLRNEAELNDVNIAHDLYVDGNVRRQLLERLESDGSFQNVEYQLRRRDGEVITVLENARVVRDAEGRALYYEGTLSDISYRKRLHAVAGTAR